MTAYINFVAQTKGTNMKLQSTDHGFFHSCENQSLNEAFIYFINKRSSILHHQEVPAKLSQHSIFHTSKNGEIPLWTLHHN